MNRLWLTVDKQFGFRPPLPFFQIVVSDACDMDRFHPVLDHIDGLHWDGIRRLDTWLIRYCGAADTPFHRAVGRHVLVAAVRRIRQPGAKFDVLTVLESAEGSGKSSLLAALAMRDKWFSDSVALNVDDKKMIESTAGKFIIEISELTGMRKGEIEKIKAQLSRQSDRARLAYGRLPVEIPRQFVAFATTNDEKYLAGLTGNRRFWPVTVGEIKLEEFRHDVDQIWAEASLAELTGESIVLERHLWSEAVQAQTERELENPFVDTLADTLEDRCGYVMVADLWSILDISPGRVTQHQQVMLGKAMLELGFTKQRREHKGHKRTAFIRRPAEGQAQRLRFNRGGGPSWCHTEVDPLT
jgi:predicted P-loop ATPase